MTYTVTCPTCGHRAPWNPTAAPVLVQCVAVRLSRQLRRQAQRSGKPAAALGSPCGTVFRVLPVAP